MSTDINMLDQAWRFAAAAESRLAKPSRSAAPAPALEAVAALPDLTVIVDVDALAHSRHARTDRRAIVLVLDALTHAGIHLMLVCDEMTEQASLLHRKLPGSTLRIRPEAVFAELGNRDPHSGIIAVSDRAVFFDALSSFDHGLALTAGATFASRPNVTAVRDLGLQPALWWLVHARGRAT